MIVDAEIEINAVETRARQSLGSSDAAIYDMVVRALSDRQIGGGTVIDVGCGRGNLLSGVRDRFSRYIGVDVVQYDGYPADAEFSKVNLETGSAPLPDNSADVVTAVETIEHLENPRAFMRELVRLAKPGGWVVVTTPNQLSVLSMLTLIVKHQFQAFQATDYPAHMTALLEIDLSRIANENGLLDVQFEYSHHGRLVLTSRHYPQSLAKLFPRALSDNVLMMGRKSNEQD